MRVAFIYGFKQLTKKKKIPKESGTLAATESVKSLVPPRRKTGDVGIRNNQKNQYGSPFKGNLVTSKLWK